MFLFKRKRREYKIILEILPTTFLCLVFFVFLFVLGGSIVIIYFAPTPTLDISSSTSLSFNQTHGKKDITLTTNTPFYGYNQELSLMFTFTQGDVVDELKKSNVLFSSEIFGYNSDILDRTSLSQDESHKRSLSCSGINSSCTPIVIFRERTIRYSHYEATIRMSQMEELFEHGLLDDEISIQIETISSSYTIFQTILRGCFCGISILLFLVYVLILLWRQFWKYSKTEQKWISLVLFSLILFNNPFFALTWALPVWIFPVIDILFITTFGNFLMLFILVISHSLLTHPKKRNVFIFYLPKVVLVFFNWLLITVTLIWERFNQEMDVSYEITENVFYETVRAFVILNSTIILMLTSFYIFKGVVTADNDQKQGRNSTPGYSRRFKVFSVFTLLVVLITGLDFLSLLFGYFNNAVQFLTFFPLYNYYCIVLALLFLPSNTRETDSRETIFRMFPSSRKERRMKRVMDMEARLDEASSPKDDDDDDGFGGAFDEKEEEKSKVEGSYDDENYLIKRKEDGKYGKLQKEQGEGYSELVEDMKQEEVVISIENLEEKEQKQEKKDDDDDDDEMNFTLM